MRAGRTVGVLYLYMYITITRYHAVSMLSPTAVPMPCFEWLRYKVTSTTR